MDLDWGTIASCGSAIAAVIALLIALWQGRASNRQSLFDRRLRIWVITEKLLSLYGDNAAKLEQKGEPEYAITLSFGWMTNTTFLQEIGPVIDHALESEHQLKLHLKLDEMKSLAMEASFAFKGKPSKAIANFLNAYQALLLAMYQYKIILDEMQTTAANFRYGPEKAMESVGEPRHRDALYKAEDELARAYRVLVKRCVAGKIKRQIKLDSTLCDYLDTFH